MEIQLAAPALPSGARADWRQWNFSAPATNRNQLVITVNANSDVAGAYFFRASA